MGDRPLLDRHTEADLTHDNRKHLFKERGSVMILQHLATHTLRFVLVPKSGSSAEVHQLILITQRQTDPTGPLPVPIWFGMKSSSDQLHAKLT